MDRKKILVTILLMFFMIILVFIGKKYNSDLGTGLWILNDTEKMMRFLNLKEKPMGLYCIDFQPKKKKAYVKFINIVDTFELKIEKKSKNTYKIYSKDNNYREFIIKPYNTKDKNFIFWYFNDSYKYKISDAENRDGIKTTDFKTIYDCINSLKEDFEFEQEQQKEE